MDQDAFDVSRRRRAGHQHRIARIEEARMLVGTMQVGDDAFGIEQHDQVLREYMEANRVRAQVERVDPETGEMHFLSSESGVTRSVEALTAASIRLGKCLHDLVARTRDPIKMSNMFIVFGARAV